jgi:hypothetical protein
VKSKPIQHHSADRSGEAGNEMYSSDSSERTDLQMMHNDAETTWQDLFLINQSQISQRATH